jgi:hypothetical protein
MAGEEKDEITALCNRVIEEKDPAKFHELVVQLNNLLERKEQRLEHKTIVELPPRTTS